MYTPQRQTERVQTALALEGHTQCEKKKQTTLNFFIYFKKTHKNWSVKLLLITYPKPPMSDEENEPSTQHAIENSRNFVRAYSALIAALFGL